MIKQKKYAVVDLFCGVGGLSHGFVLEGFNVVAGIDSDQSCAFAFSENNNAKFICSDINEIDPKEIEKLFPKKSIKILVGCAPCQPFSRYTAGVKPKNTDNKWSLLSSFAKIIEVIQPDIISMENVPQLAKYNKNGVYSKFIKTLKENNYYISDTQKIVYCPEFGVPQNRKRLVLLASKFGNINLISPLYSKENYPTVKSTIGKLPKIKDGEICKTDSLHRAQKLSDLNKKRIRLTKEGGSWRNWPDDLKLKCHKKLSGKTFGDVYGRMKWDEPSPTLTTHCIGLGNGRFGHPEQHRAISLREAALLQSFPIDYKFIDDTKGEVISKNIQRQIGNAVPVKLGEAIARSIKIHLEKILN
ncbi:MAG: DNA (cytosine-5-)-methyltransferase [Bacteroidetes bacterium GWA2_32_17]|nr:MAG: DNA (cytosine-5-)-methyltransferase [Bacteroidetes bacterium GWA2_32_17]